MPFSKVLFVYGDPIDVPRRLDVEGSEKYRMAVEQGLKNLVELGEMKFDEFYASGER